MSPSDLKAKSPFSIPIESLYSNILRTGSILSNRVSRLLRQKDLTEPGYDILRVLRATGGAGRCPGDIASKMVAAVPDMTRLIDRLEQRGLIERRRVDVDRRMVRVFILEKGLNVLTDLDAPRLEEIRRLLGGLTGPEQSNLNDLLDKLRTHVIHSGSDSPDTST